MIETRAQLRRWGRSFGVVIPMDKIKEEGLGENDRLEIIITKEENPLEKTFGTLKFKKTTKQILEKGDKESWDG